MSESIVRLIRKCLKYRITLFTFLVLLTITTASSAQVLPNDTKLMRNELNYLIESGTISKKTIFIKIDHVIGKIVNVHINKIIELGYGKNLNTEDFFHGHFRIADPNICPPNGKFHLKGPHSIYGAMPQSLDKRVWIKMFLRSDPYFLYHTREYTLSDWKIIKDSEEVWEQEILYIGDMPRSIIGDKHGKVFPIKDNSIFFSRYGSADALIESEINGKRISRMCSGMKSIYQYYGGKRIRIGNMFLILRDANGRYVTSGGVAFELFFLGN